MKSWQALNVSRSYTVLSQAEINDHSSRSIDKLIGTSELAGAESCYSVLVKTGIITLSKLKSHYFKDCRN